MIDKSLSLHVESLIFAAEKPISIDDINAVLSETLQMIISPQDIIEAVDHLKTKFASEDYSFEIIDISGGLSFMTKGAYHLTIANYLKQTTTKKLSKAALETLSIIAYKQPVSKSEIEHIRGVNCDYAVQKLLDKELIEIKGRSESVGKPLLYGTSEKFFDYFGLKGIQDLPKLKDFELSADEIGSPDDIEVPVLIDGKIVKASTQEDTFEETTEISQERTFEGKSVFEDTEIETEVFNFDDDTDIGKNTEEE